MRPFTAWVRQSEGLAILAAASVVAYLIGVILQRVGQSLVERLALAYSGWLRTARPGGSGSDTSGPTERAEDSARSHVSRGSTRPLVRFLRSQPPFAAG